MSVSQLFDQAASAKRVDKITIRRPDDFHVHLRDGAMLQAVLPFTANQFARGIIMPNLVPPVTTVEAAAAYRERILAARPDGSDFEPLMTCYLADTTTPDEIDAVTGHTIHHDKAYCKGNGKLYHIPLHFTIRSSVPLSP